MSGESKESILPFLGAPASILRRQYTSQSVTPRGKSAGRPIKKVLGSVTPGPHLRNDDFQRAGSASEQQRGKNQPPRADSPKLGSFHTQTEYPMVVSPEDPSTPRSLVSVRSMPVAPVEQDRLEKYGLEEYSPSPYASYMTPLKTGQPSPLQSPLIIVADSDPKLADRQSVLSTLIPSQKEGSLVVPESDTSSPPMPLMKDYCASSDEECTSTSVSFKSVCSDIVTIFDFARMIEPEEDGRSVEATKSPMSDPGPSTEQKETRFDEHLLASCGHLPRVSPNLKPLDLKLSIDTDIEKAIMNDPDPSFHRAIGSPREPVKEAFVEQVGSAFYIKNLKNDSLGRLPRITALEQSLSEHESPELIAIQESSLDECRSRRSGTFSSNSSNETIRPGARNIVILPGESDRRYHSHCYRRSRGEMDIGSAASINFESEGSVSPPPHARHRRAIVLEGPSRPPASPATPTVTALPEAAWVRAASEEFSSSGFSLLKKGKDSIVLERKPFPPGQGGGNSQGINPAPPIKTTVVCYANVLPEQPKVPIPIVTVGDSGSGRPDSASKSSGFSSVKYSRISVASSMLHVSGHTGGSEGSKSLRSVKALLLNEGIQLKDDDNGKSENGAPGDRLSHEARSLRTVQS